MARWTEDDITTLRKMLREGYPSHVIGKAVNRKASAVRRYVAMHEHDLRLTKGKQRGRGHRCNQSEFDKQWYGVVPRLHWTITKPWSVNNG